MMIPNQNVHAMTPPAYAEAIVAVGRMLKSKAGEPRVRQFMRIAPGSVVLSTKEIEPGTGRFKGRGPWPVRDGSGDPLWKPEAA